MPRNFAPDDFETFDIGTTTTAMPAVNAIPAVVAAPPGVLPTASLPLITAPHEVEQVIRPGVVGFSAIVGEGAGKVSPAVQDPPDVDGVVVGDVEDEVRKPSGGNGPELGDLELIGEAQRAQVRRGPDPTNRLLERFDEVKGHGIASLMPVVVDDDVDVGCSPSAKSDCPLRHGRVQALVRARVRNDSK